MRVFGKSVLGLAIAVGLLTSVASVSAQAQNRASSETPATITVKVVEIIDAEPARIVRIERTTANEGTSLNIPNAQAFEEALPGKIQKLDAALEAGKPIKVKLKGFQIIDIL